MIEFLSLVENELKQNLIDVYVAIEKEFQLPQNVKVNLSFVSQNKIKELNKTTRNIDKVTDVLSYPYTDLKPNEKLNIDDYKFDIDPSDNTLTFGDVYICKARAKQQAKEFGHSETREICFLFCHSMLHLLGYDHIKEKDAMTMEAKQKEIMDKVGIKREPFKCGFVTIIGETNAGKSTLINALVGEHVAIVSPKTQTTRENIVGVFNDEHTQIVFVDTPGYHKRHNLIDDEMDKQIKVAQEDTEIVLMMIVAKKPLVEQYNKLIKNVNESAKKILLINKVDEVKYEKVYPQLVELGKIAKVDEILPISALTKRNVDVLLEMVKKFLPTFDREIRYYPVDEYTDKNLRHITAEIVREKALLLLDDEIPHGIQVVVTDYKEDEKPIHIYADVYCEKDSHKAIILGKNGEMIKKISTAARKAIEHIIGEQINLQLYVKVKSNWRNDINAISEFGLKVEE